MPQRDSRLERGGEQEGVASSPWEASEREGTGTAACLGMSQFVVTRCATACGGTGVCGARCCGAASSEDDRAGTDVACSFPPTHPSTCVCVRGVARRDARPWGGRTCATAGGGCYLVLPPVTPDAITLHRLPLPSARRSGSGCSLDARPIRSPLDCSVARLARGRSGAVWLVRRSAALPKPRADYDRGRPQKRLVKHPIRVYIS